MWEIYFFGHLRLRSGNLFGVAQGPPFGFARGPRFLPGSGTRASGHASWAKQLEAATGVEPVSRGFADLRLNHLATPPLSRSLNVGTNINYSRPHAGQRVPNEAVGRPVSRTNESQISLKTWHLSCCGESRPQWISRGEGGWK